MRTEAAPLDLTSGQASALSAAEHPGAQAGQPFLEALALSNRLQFLRIEAEIDGVPFSEASLSDLQSFLREARPGVRPSLFLNDNGNLRALWKNEAGEQIGLQFLGDGEIQFVIFKLRPGSLRMARIAGVDSSERILHYVRASRGEGLLSV